MKFKIVQFEDSGKAYIVVTKRALLYLLATGYKPTTIYQGHEVDAQRGRWAGEFKFGDKEDAEIFSREHLTVMTEVEEITKEVEKEGA